LFGKDEGSDTVRPENKRDFIKVIDPEQGLGDNEEL
jgi:hypothetical protein